MYYVLLVIRVLLHVPIVLERLMQNKQHNERNRIGTLLKDINASKH